MRSLAPRRALAATLVAVLALILSPTAAWADTPGGSTPGDAVALPIPDFDSSFVASNAGEVSTPGWLGPGLPIWNNVTWYSVTPVETTAVFIRATSAWDNTLEVWTAGGTLVTQNDDFYWLDSSVTVTLIAGTTYRIGLGGYSSGARGTATLTFASRLPSAASSVSATAGNGSATVSWAAPADVAGGVTEYQVLCTPEGGTETVCASRTGTPPPTSATVNGLMNGTAYTFRVAAGNVLGFGDPSAPSDPVTPKAPSVVALSVEPAVPVSGQSFAVTATVTSGGAPATGTVDVTVDGVTTSGIALVGGQATVAGLTHLAGAVELSASYSGSAGVEAAAGTSTLTVTTRSQTLTLSALPDGPVYDAMPVTVSATSSESLPVTVVASGACTLSGDQLNFTGVGTCRLDATQAGTSEVAAASAAVEAVVGQRPQTLVVGDLAPMVYAERTTLTATSSVGLPVTLSADGACTVDDGDVVATGVGECTVTASQPGDVVTAAATAVVRSQAVGKRPQAVTLSEIPDLAFAMTPIPMVATSEHGLPVSLSASGACVVIDGELQVIGVGTCSVTATAEGDAVTLEGSATVSREVTGPATEVAIGLDAELGDGATGVAVSASGVGLLPGSDLVLEVHSTPQRIASVVVAANGTATVGGLLPVLEAGDHELVALGMSLAGEPISMVATFTVDGTGRIVRIADASLQAPSTPSAGPGALASTGADPSALVALGLVWIVAGSLLLAVRRRSLRVTA